MAATRLFECTACGAFGKITLKGDELQASDVAYCPACGSDISEPEEYDDPEDE